ncbi:MAG: hypothetical protein V1776_02465 [Candidatus Diapherotrites archaeon]
MGRGKDTQRKERMPHEPTTEEKIQSALVQLQKRLIQNGVDPEQAQKIITAIRIGEVRYNIRRGMTNPIHPEMVKNAIRETMYSEPDEKNKFPPMFPFPTQPEKETHSYPIGSDAARKTGDNTLLIRRGNVKSL